MACKAGTYDCTNDAQGRQVCNTPSSTSSTTSPPTGPTVLPNPSRKGTKDCGWLFVASPYLTINSWDKNVNGWGLPTEYFETNAGGETTLNTTCVRLGALEFQSATIPKGTGYTWEQYPLGSDNANVCCLEYFESERCDRTPGKAVDVRKQTTAEVLFDVKALRFMDVQGSGQTRRERRARWWVALQGTAG